MELELTASRGTEAKSQRRGNEALERLRLKLLDLTARNRLLSMKHTKSATLRVIDELPDQLCQTLLDEREMSFRAVPYPTREALIRAGRLTPDGEGGTQPSAEEWARHLGLETGFEVPLPPSDPSGVQADKHSDLAVQTLLYPAELEAQLGKLGRVTRTAREETGSNILYVALGFLEWFENAGDADKSRQAPLYLVPVTLTKGRLNEQTGTYEYRIAYSGEEVMTNLSLREKLRRDFGLALPEVADDTMPEAYFREVQHLIRENQPRWKVRRYVTVALLNFQKMMMWRDLDPENWPRSHLDQHPVVSQLLQGRAAEVQRLELGYGAEHPIDERPDIHRRYPVIYDADSSQHSAVIDAVDGKNLVIEGPPGTGKSQTITNLIAATLAQGKSVLFVAEKLAALEVVKRRLDAAGLGSFCLELHSHKSNKRQVIEEIGKRLSTRGTHRAPAEIEVEIARYEELKTSLKSHVELINSPWAKTGKTIHEILVGAARFRDFVGHPADLHINGLDGNSFAPLRQRELLDLVKKMQALAHTACKQCLDTAVLATHPWFGVNTTQLQVYEAGRIRQALLAWNDALGRLDASVQDIDRPPQPVPVELSQLDALANQMMAMPPTEGIEDLSLLGILEGEGLTAARQELDVFDSIRRRHQALSDALPGRAVCEIDVDRVADGYDAIAPLASPQATVQELERIKDRLGELAARVDGIRDAVRQVKEGAPGELTAAVNDTADGIHEFYLLLRFRSALKPSEWRLRDRRFEDEELDEVLPQLERRLTELLQKADGVSKHFEVDALLEADMQEIGSELAQGGAFRWFKPGWWRARSKLVALGVGVQRNFAALEAQLDEAVAFWADARAFVQERTFDRLLGGHFQGLKTDLQSLEQVRNWYREVRAEYGAGFGPRVAIGRALVAMPDDVAEGLKDLCQAGLEDRLRALDSEIMELRRVLIETEAALPRDRPLGGPDGQLRKVRDTLAKGLNGLNEMVSQRQATLAELGGRIQDLREVQTAVAEWNHASESRVLQRFALDPTCQSNHDALAAVATVNLANWLRMPDRQPFIERSIVEGPTFETLEALRQRGHTLAADLRNESELREAFMSLTEADPARWCAEQRGLGALAARNVRALDAGSSLEAWLEFIRVKHVLQEEGLGRIASELEGGRIKVESVVEGFWAGAYDQLAREVLGQRPALASFSGRAQSAMRKQFVEYDKRLSGLQREKVASIIDAREVPQGVGRGPKASYTERALLDHECSKQRRHLPIRALIRGAADALVGIKPCFMMGPMSVAQYLEPGAVEFDLIVMDEASQIRPEDALGAAARGKQLVVVGDPKQLPPTSFFDRMIEENPDDEELAAIEEAESILDSALSIFTRRQLRWHYRSQHESLIEFSNYSFYDSNLVVFPSPAMKSPDLGLKFSRVRKGLFVNRRNLEEARVIAEAVREHFKTRPEESLGVVAMSAEQREHVERSIEELAKEDPLFRASLEQDAAKDESHFVKNLENVQGDERDVIFISMTYGPNEPKGRVYQRFGPINSDMGWRRLNVLFTRARKRMHVFSSMGSDDVLASAGSGRGVVALREFLAFAETGVLHHAQHETGRPAGSDFELAVTHRLERAGYNCVPQVGVAGFFIDIGVRDPDNPGRFLMGIECDGAYYHSGKSVRDRDRLRQQILESLGWRIRRIWSTDWFQNPEGEVKPIVEELNGLREQRTSRSTAVAAVVAQELSSKTRPSGTTEEVEVIQAIIADANEDDTLDIYVRGAKNLEATLREFDANIIHQELPNTPDDRRLLRPEMIAALCNFTPASKWEFVEYVPNYLREGTAEAELRFLDKVLRIVGDANQN